MRFAIRRLLMYFVVMKLPHGQAQFVVLCCAIMLFGSHFVIPQSDAAYQNFAFRKLEANVLSPYQMIHVSQENAQFVRSYVLKEMEAHGLTHASSPDIHVDIFVSLKLERQNTGGSTYTENYSSTTSGVSIYEVGTLTVQLNEVENNNLLWEGSRTIPLWTKKEKKIRKRVKGMISKIFKGFDPNTLGN